MASIGLACMNTLLWISKDPIMDAYQTHIHEPKPPFPFSWFNSPDTYSLERQALFGRYWLQITHSNRIKDVGDYARVDIAGHRLVVVKGVDRSLHVFHNERPKESGLLVKKRQGTGKAVHENFEWSLNIEGKLIRLPCKLNRQSHSTVQLAHVHVDSHGFVWVNLDKSEQPRVSWEEQASCVDVMDKFKGFRAADYVYSHSWSMCGDFDWKTFVDYHFNEYCHTNVKTTPSEKSQSCKEPTSMVVNFDRELLLSPTYIFPATMVAFNDMHMCLVRCEPIGPGQADMHVEIYRHKKCSHEEFLDMEDLLQEIVQEDIMLCNMRQHVLDRCHYKAGEKWDNKTGAGSWLRLIKTILECR